MSGRASGAFRSARSPSLAFVIWVLVVVLGLALAGALASRRSAAAGAATRNTPQDAAPLTYLGFDANTYPGDAALPLLKETFAFSGYWLNAPPGAKENTWSGKREILRKNGFGFLVLFNGRTERQLKAPDDPATLGQSDAEAAVESARREGFPDHTVIFLDQEEGGRMTAVQMTYISNWIEPVMARHFYAGIYCSGIAAKEGGGKTVVTADDIRARVSVPNLSFFVYNDGCPPSPGCVYPKIAPQPSLSGVKYASIWQFAQSPRRHEFTRACSATYSTDGNCYPTNRAGAGSLVLDLDSATSPDPSTVVPRRTD
jgi:hypothetical protein